MCLKLWILEFHPLKFFSWYALACGKSVIDGQENLPRELTRFYLNKKFSDSWKSKRGKMASSQLLTSWKSRIQTLPNDRPLYTQEFLLMHFCTRHFHLGNERDTRWSLAFTAIFTISLKNNFLNFKIISTIPKWVFASLRHQVFATSFCYHYQSLTHLMFGIFFGQCFSKASDTFVNVQHFANITYFCLANKS